MPILCVFLIPELSLVGFLWIEKALDQRFLASVKEGLGRGTAYGPGPGEKEAFVSLVAKEREIVEKYFPPMVFENQAGRELTLTFDSVKFPDRKHEIPLGDIQSIKIEKYKKVYYLVRVQSPHGAEVWGESPGGLEKTD